MHGDRLFIARPGRELFRPVTLEREVTAAMPLYVQNRDAAAREVAARKQRNRDFNADEYEEREGAVCSAGPDPQWRRQRNVP